ncbi:hypothetical protein Hanom_Chr07g00620791 [Helianthus anomalus]
MTGDDGAVCNDGGGSGPTRFTWMDVVVIMFIFDDGSCFGFDFKKTRSESGSRSSGQTQSTLG